MARLVCIFPSIHYLISDDDSKRSFLRHLFASAFVHETVSSTDNKRQKEKDWNDKTFTFMQTSPPVQLGQKLVPGQARQVIETRLLVWKWKERPTNFPWTATHLQPLQAWYFWICISVFFFKDAVEGVANDPTGWRRSIRVLQSKLLVLCQVRQKSIQSCKWFYHIHLNFIFLSDPSGADLTIAFSSSSFSSFSSSH